MPSPQLKTRTISSARDRSAALNLEEDLGRLETRHVDHRVEVIGHDAHDVADDAAAGDVRARRGSLRRVRRRSAVNGRRVDDRGQEQFIAEGRSSPPGYAGSPSERRVAHQNRRARASTRSSEAPASASPRARRRRARALWRARRAFHHAEREAGQIQFVGLHHATVFGGLTAEQRGLARVDTPRRRPRRELANCSGLEPADGDVVQARRAVRHPRRRGRRRASPRGRCPTES